MKEYLAELTVYSAGAEKTLYFSTHGCVVGTTYYEPRILHPGILKMMLFSDGTTMGKSTVGYGELRLINTDGALDYLLDAGFAGRTVLIKTLIAGVATLLMSCSMEQPTYDATTLNVRIKDPQQALTVPVQPNKYGGTNVLPDGIDGVADIKGKPKPLLYGQVSNATPVCVNTSRLIYQLHDGTLQSITNVYDKGVALPAGVDRATNALLQSNPPSPGTYDTCLAEGLFRLGSSAIGSITADAIQGATAADRTVAKIAITLFSVLNTGYYLPDFTTLDTLNSSVIGIYISDETQLSTALDEVFGSIGAWYGFDTTGVLRTGRFGDPAGTPAAELTKYEIASLDRLATQDEGRGVPAWKVNVNYDKNYTIQDAASLAGSVITNKRWEFVPTGSGTSIPMRSMAYGNGLFVGVGDLFSKRSVDGEIWLQSGSAHGNRIAYGDGKFVTTSTVGNFSGNSSDGYTWAIASLPASGGWYALAFGEGLFVTCKVGSTIGAYSSNGGVTWTASTMPSNSVTKLVYGAGLFVGVSSTGISVVSNDGITWSTGTMPSASGWCSVTYGNGMFVAVAFNSEDAATSTDGINWTLRKLPSVAYWQDVNYGDGVFMATTITGDGQSITASSFDGITWTQIYVPSYGYFEKTCFGNNMFIGLYPSTTEVGLFRTSAGSGRPIYTSKQYRTVTDTDDTVKIPHLNASEITFNTLMVSADNALTEATRQLNIRKVRRDYIFAKIKRSALATMPTPGSIIKITYPRYGYDAGKLFVLIGYEMTLATDDLILQLWG
jgi:hypothetical protein